MAQPQEETKQTEAEHRGAKALPALCVCVYTCGAFDQQIFIHTHTVPRDKQSRDSTLIIFQFYQEAQTCTLCLFAF